MRIMLAALLGPAWPAPVRQMVKLDQVLDRAMAGTGAQGIAAAIVDGGRVVAVAAQGRRNAAGGPLSIDTIMYGASLTKAAFGVVVMQLAEQGRIDRR